MKRFLHDLFKKKQQQQFICQSLQIYMYMPFSELSAQNLYILYKVRQNPKISLQKSPKYNIGGFAV